MSEWAREMSDRNPEIYLELLNRKVDQNGILRNDGIGYVGIRKEHCNKFNCIYLDYVIAVK